MVAKINSPITPLEQTEKTNEIIDDLNDKLYRVELNGIRSNCITDIPQDIKIELNNGIVTLKAGSKVYVPNGSGVFDVVNVSSDITLTQQWGEIVDCFLFLYGGSILNIMPLSRCSSGSSDSISGSDHFYYNTTNNTLRFIESSGNVSNTAVSLPIAIIKMSGNEASVTSINQVFNGFGFIGSTVFALPGVKGLIPNGRNADGSLKNIEFTTTSVFTRTIEGISNFHEFAIATAGIGINDHTLNEQENYIYNAQGAKLADRFVAGNITFSQTSPYKVTFFNPKTTFRALDRNDKSTIAGFSMPSNKHIDLTLGASGATYTAPANGWFYFAKIANSSNQYMTMYVNNSDPPIFATTITQPINGGQARLFLPVKQGDVVGVSYNLAGETRRFCFVYAEGEV